MGNISVYGAPLLPDLLNELSIPQRVDAFSLTGSMCRGVKGDHFRTPLDQVGDYVCKVSGRRRKAMQDQDPGMTSRIPSPTGTPIAQIEQFQFFSLLEDRGEWFGDFYSRGNEQVEGLPSCQPRPAMGAQPEPASIECEQWKELCGVNDERRTKLSSIPFNHSYNPLFS